MSESIKRKKKTTIKTTQILETETQHPFSMAHLVLHHLLPLSILLFQPQMWNPFRTQPWQVSEPGGNDNPNPQGKAPQIRNPDHKSQKVVAIQEMMPRVSFSN